MHRNRSKKEPEYQIQPEITAYLRRVRREFLEREEMTNQNMNQPRLFGDMYALNFNNAHRVRKIDAESYAISPAL